MEYREPNIGLGGHEQGSYEEHHEAPENCQVHQAWIGLAQNPPLDQGVVKQSPKGAAYIELDFFRLAYSPQAVAPVVAPNK